MNKRLEKSRELWDKVKSLEERAERLPLTKEIDDLKSTVSDFIVPILLSEVEHCNSICKKLIENWEKYYELDRRLDVKRAMDAFDAQFIDIDQKLSHLGTS